MAYPTELLRHQIIAVATSAVLSIAGIAALIYGLRSGGDYASGLVAYGIVSLLVGLAMAHLTFSWYRRAARLVAAGTSITAHATLIRDESMESTSLYVGISLSGSNTQLPVRVAVLTPAWDYTNMLQGSHTVALFIEPRSSKLMAVSTIHGTLWCIPHNQVFPGTGAA